MALLDAWRGEERRVISGNKVVWAIKQKMGGTVLYYLHNEVYSVTPPLSLPLLVVASSFRQKGGREVFLLLVTMLSSFSREKRRGWPLCNKSHFRRHVFACRKKITINRISSENQIKPRFLSLAGCPEIPSSICSESETPLLFNMPLLFLCQTKKTKGWQRVPRKSQKRKIKFHNKLNLIF